MSTQQRFSVLLFSVFFFLGGCFDPQEKNKFMKNMYISALEESYILVVEEPLVVLFSKSSQTCFGCVHPDTFLKRTRINTRRGDLNGSSVFKMKVCLRDALIQ